MWHEPSSPSTYPHKYCQYPTLVQIGHLNRCHKPYGYPLHPNSFHPGFHGPETLPRHFLWSLSSNHNFIGFTSFSLITHASWTITWKDLFFIFLLSSIIFSIKCPWVNLYSITLPIQCPWVIGDYKHILVFHFSSSFEHCSFVKLDCLVIVITYIVELL